MDQLAEKNMSHGKWQFIALEAYERVNGGFDHPVFTRDGVNYTLLFARWGLYQFIADDDAIDILEHIIESLRREWGNPLEFGRLTQESPTTLTVNVSENAIIQILYGLMRNGFAYRSEHNEKKLVHSPIFLMRDYYDEHFDEAPQDMNLIPLYALGLCHQEETRAMCADPMMMIEGRLSDAKKFLTTKGRNELLMQLQEWSAKAKQENYDRSEAQTLMKQVRRIARDARVAKLALRSAAAKKQIKDIIEKASSLFTQLSTL